MEEDKEKTYDSSDYYGCIELERKTGKMISPSLVSL